MHVIQFMNVQGTVLSQMADDSYMGELIMIEFIIENFYYF